MSNEKTFEDQVKEWMQLVEDIEALGRQIRQSDSPPCEEIFAEVSSKMVDRIVLEARLVEAVSSRAVIDDLTDPRVRGGVMRLVQKGREQIDQELSEPWEMDWETECEGIDDIYALVGSPKEWMLRQKRVSNIVALAKIPERIHELLEEAKICYTTGQQNAVMAVGRMMLEYSVTDVGVRLNLFPEPGSVDDYFRKYPPYNRADLLLGEGSSRRQQFRDLYRQGSQTIHSSKDNERGGGEKFLEEVIQFIGEVYTVNHHQLRR